MAHSVDGGADHHLALQVGQRGQACEGVTSRHALLGLEVGSVCTGGVAHLDRDQHRAAMV